MCYDGMSAQEKQAQVSQHARKDAAKEMGTYLIWWISGNTCEKKKKTRKKTARILNGKSGRIV